MSNIKFSRQWCMPSPNTFSVKPIADLLARYIDKNDKNLVVVDPFARNSKWGTLTNDINPHTEALHNMDAVDYLDMLVQFNVQADVVLFDPPYSPRQVSECYKEIGLKVTMSDTQNSVLNKDCKDLMVKLVKKGGIVISFGWNSGGVGKTRGFSIIEIMLVAHGGVHNDTIVTVERKL